MARNLFDINNGLHKRGSRHHVKHSCRSDVIGCIRSGRGGYPSYPFFSVYRRKQLSVTHLGVLRAYLYYYGAE
eukprot:6191023-Pleurochrysis_carterae.AAC.1